MRTTAPAMRRAAASTSARRQRGSPLRGGLAIFRRLDHLARRANKPYRPPMLRKIILALAMLVATPALGRRAGRQCQRLHDPRGRPSVPLQRHVDRRRRPGRGSSTSAATRGRTARASCSNGRGRTLIPGLIDAHGHVMELGMRRARARPFRHPLARRSAAADRRLCRRQSDAALDRRRGWNQERWHLGRFPTAAELDAAVGDRPVWLERVDGHAGWANSMAMREANVTAATPRPGGRADRARPAGRRAASSSMPPRR